MTHWVLPHKRRVTITHLNEETGIKRNLPSFLSNHWRVWEDVQLFGVGAQTVWSRGGIYHKPAKIDRHRWVADAQKQRHGQKLCCVARKNRLINEHCAASGGSPPHRAFWIDSVRAWWTPRLSSVLQQGMLYEVKPVLVSLGHGGIPLPSHPLQTALSSFLTHAVSNEVLGCCFSCIWPPISPDPWDTSDS